MARSTTRTAAPVITLEDRRTLVATKGATLNGNPAIISGTQNAFATVTDKTTRLGCEFAWATVARIVANGGEFRS
jgi:hypothetical protein